MAFLTLNQFPPNGGYANLHEETVYFTTRLAVYSYDEIISLHK
jgi:hypothetical protein